MSIFRIQRKKLEHKVHSQESKSYSKNAKNLTEILGSVRQKEETQLHIKRRVFTLEENEQESNITKLKRISETYNLKTNRRDSMRNSKISKNSLSGSKFFPVFSPGIIRSSPKLENKFSGQLKNKEKATNTSEQKISIEKGKKQYISLNSSFVSKGSKTKIQSNRMTIEQKSRNFKEIYHEAMEYYRKKNSQKALMTLKQCLRYERDNVDCLYHMGSCYLNLKQYEESLKYLSHAKELNPSYNTNLYLYLAINFKTLKRQEEALKILQAGIKVFPNFEEGYLYIGKIYIRQGKFDAAIAVFEECLEVNENNFIGRIMLVDAYIWKGEEEKAIEVLKSVLRLEGFINLDLQTKISTHLKLIKLLLKLEQYDDLQIKTSLSFLQQASPTSPQLAYYKSLLTYQTSLFISPKQLSEMKINLFFAMNELNNYSTLVECIKLLLKIYLDNKDFYGAEQLLKRVAQGDVKADHFKEWGLLIEGANDVIKRKTEEGKDKILKLVKKLNSKTKRNNKHFTNPQQLTSRDINYLKLHAFSFLAYILFLEEKLSETLSIYEQLSNNSAGQTQRQSQKQLFNKKFIKRYSSVFKQIELNKITIEALVDHKAKQNFINAKKGFEILMQQRHAPESIFMWIINEISLLRKMQTQFAQKQQEMGQQGSKEKHENNQSYDQSFDWSKLFQKAEKAEEISPSYSLIYFYHSLALLYLQSFQQALQKVQSAIQKTQQPVSQYHFIEALCHYLIYQQTQDIQSAFRGLQAIDRAIEIDSSIPQFYKQRSKHLFCLGKYEEAVKDCEKCLEESSDQEIKLLCMFYCYSVGQYAKAEGLLGELMFEEREGEKRDESKDTKMERKDYQKDCDLDSGQQLNQHKYKQFQQGLMFRLKKYSRTGFLSQLFLTLTTQNSPKLQKSYVKLLHDAINDRHQYSQFTVYFMNLLLAAYSIYQNDYSTCLNHLFCCLQQIQSVVDEKEKHRVNDGEEVGNEEIGFGKSRVSQEVLKIDTEQMLNQIKFNIVLATLLKNRHQKTTNHKSTSTIQETYREAINLIQTFEKESQCEQLIENLQVIKSLILKSQFQPKSQQINTEMKNLEKLGSVPVYLKPYAETYKFSDQLPYIVVPIGDKYVLMTKFLIFYPSKLRFNIKPEFDPSFLFNFDIDKVDNKITPPWYRFSDSQPKGQFQNRIIFTDQLRNQSIALSSTERQPSVMDNSLRSKNRYEKNNFNESEKRLPSQLHQKGEKQADFKKLIKLDSKIEKKLKKLFPK